jgi:hypothetical protein
MSHSKNFLLTEKHRLVHLGGILRINKGKPINFDQEIGQVVLWFCQGALDRKYVHL